MTRCYQCSRPAVTELPRALSPPFTAKRKTQSILLPVCETCKEVLE